MKVQQNSSKYTADAAAKRTSLTRSIVARLVESTSSLTHVHRSVDAWQAGNDIFKREIKMLLLSSGCE